MGTSRERGQHLNLNINLHREGAGLPLLGLSYSATFLRVNVEYT